MSKPQKVSIRNVNYRLYMSVLHFWLTYGFRLDPYFFNGGSCSYFYFLNAFKCNFPIFLEPLLVYTKIDWKL